MESKGSRFFWWQKQTWCLCGVLMWHQLRRWTSMLWVTLELGNWTVGIAVVQVLVAATWACGKNAHHRGSSGEFKPNTFPKPTKGMHCLLVVVSKHLLFKIELSLLIPKQIELAKIIRSSNILRRSHNEIYMISSYCIKSSSLDPWNLMGEERSSLTTQGQRLVPFGFPQKQLGFPTKNDQHLGCEMGVPPFKETPKRRFIWLCKNRYPKVDQRLDLKKKAWEELYITPGLTNGFVGYQCFS